MTTLFDLESDLINHAYEVSLEDQELLDIQNDISILQGHVAFEMETLDVLVNKEEELPALTGNDLLNELTMECAIGSMGSVLMGLASVESDSIPSEDMSCNWKEKIDSLQSKTEALVTGLFAKIEQSSQQTIEILTARNNRSKELLNKLKVEVEATNEIVSDTMNRPLDFVLSEDPFVATEDVNKTTLAFNEFLTNVIQTKLKDCEQYLTLLENSTDVEINSTPLTEKTEFTLLVKSNDATTTLSKSIPVPSKEKLLEFIDVTINLCEVFDGKITVIFSQLLNLKNKLNDAIVHQYEAHSDNAEYACDVIQDVIQVITRILNQVHNSTVIHCDVIQMCSNYAMVALRHYK